MTMRRALLFVLLAGMLLPAPALAVRPGEQLADPALETRARRLSAELRCLVCQNQSIDDSDAELAGDLRRIVRERITAGDSDSAIRSFLVSRYGEFVLLKPPLSGHTILLWGLPGFALLMGMGAAYSLFRRRGQGGRGQENSEDREDSDEPASEPVLSEAEQQELDDLLRRKSGI